MNELQLYQCGVFVVHFMFSFHCVTFCCVYKKREHVLFMYNYFLKWDFFFKILKNNCPNDEKKQLILMTKMSLQEKKKINW